MKIDHLVCEKGLPIHQVAFSCQGKRTGVGVESGVGSGNWELTTEIDNGELRMENYKLKMARQSGHLFS
jgi:hypothetical protein